MNYNPSYGTAPYNNQSQTYPGQQPAHDYPGQTPSQGYPGQTPSQGYPGQTPSQGYPGQQSSQGYPGHPSNQGYPGHSVSPASNQNYGRQQQTTFPNYGGGPPSGIDPTIFSWFKAVDQDNSGEINAAELQAALQNGNRSHFSDEACKLMIAMFDRDNSGSINVQEFASLFQYINQWTQTYRKFDSDNSGTIDEREFTAAIRQMGYNLSPEFSSFIMNKFGGKQRKIAFDDFIVINVQLHRVTESFKQKDTQMKGIITIGYEEFLRMALTI